VRAAALDDDRERGVRPFTAEEADPVVQVITDEAQRLAAVRRYHVLDTPPDGAFDRITSLAARLFEVPISIVSIVDADRIWFKSHHGVDAEQIGRDPGLCASAVLQSEPWMVNDARTDPRTLANPLVAGELGLQFYAGVPLTTHDGYNLGTLCVIDQEPRRLTEAQVASLTDLAQVVMDELELRLAARRTVELESQLRRGAEEISRMLQQSLLPARVPDVPGLDIAARYHVANEDEIGGDFYDVVADGEGGCAVVVGDVCGKGTTAASLTGTARWVLRASVADSWTPASALARLNSVMVRAQEEPGDYCTAALVKIEPVQDGQTTVTVGLAGHPHPLLLRTDGTTERVGATSPVVGWSLEASYDEVATPMGVGDLLVLFTDGTLEVVAGHGATDDTSIRELLTPLAGRGAEAVADALDQALGARTLRDDAAFVVVAVR
jgi:sigma-B regulation protein RsbU (phosphoserine phosphatase)